MVTVTAILDAGPCFLQRPISVRRQSAKGILVAAAAIACFAGPSASAMQQGSATFNPAFLTKTGASALDIARFENAGEIVPGSYRVDVVINGNRAGREQVRVEAGPGKNAQPAYCMEPSQLERLGIALDRIPQQDDKATAGCMDAATLAPDIIANFDFSALVLELTVPQIYVRRALRGYVDPSNWDSGVTAGFIDYNADAYQTKSSGIKQSQYYAGINAGLNAGSWRFRHNGNYNRVQGRGSHSKYTSINNYAQRDLTGLKSQLTVGQYYTQAGLFDSVPFTGVQIAADDRMLPDSQRGFAPIIRGIAQSNATVTVRQGSNVLYETTVAPGPFAIDDLYGTGYAGDLEVTVTEADGSVRSFVVPYASVPQLLRPGVSRLTAVAGKLRSDTGAAKPEFLQATYQHGISNTWTAYGGVLGSKNYQSALAGAAVSTSYGAVSVDVTHARATGLPKGSAVGASTAGQSYRISYSKTVNSTQTNFALAAHRFSSDGYLNFLDYSQLRDEEGGRALRQRNRFQLNVNQPLPGRYGSVYISGAAQNYWEKGRKSDVSYQAGYSNTFGRVNASLSVARTQTMGGGPDTRYMLNLSFPLGASSRAAYLTSTVNYSDAGGSNVQTGVSGTVGDANELSYSVYGSRAQHRGTSATNVGASGLYRSAVSDLSAGVSQGQGFHQINGGVRGSILVHPGGVNFSREQGETRAIVAAQGAEGAALFYSNGSKIAGNGYGVVSGLAAYRNNEIAIDPKNISSDVEMELTSQTAVPRYGAIVMLKYPTKTGKPLLLHVLDATGRALPVGAEVLDTAGNPVTLVGQGSHIFLRTERREGKLEVRWGTGATQRCAFEYRFPSETGTDNPLPRSQSTCVAA